MSLYDIYNSSKLHIYFWYNIPQLCSDRAVFHPCGETSSSNLKSVDLINLIVTVSSLYAIACLYSFILEKLNAWSVSFEASGMTPRSLATVTGTAATCPWLRLGSGSLASKCDRPLNSWSLSLHSPSSEYIPHISMVYTEHIPSIWHDWSERFHVNMYMRYTKHTPDINYRSIVYIRCLV